MVLSALQLASKLPSGENAMSFTSSVWPVRVARQAPLVVSHNRTVLSPLALARNLREGENAILQTSFAWPDRVKLGFELARFQRKICRLSSPEANANLVAINSMDLFFGGGVFVGAAGTRVEELQ
jgi:hypothetical protein